MKYNGFFKHVNSKPTGEYIEAFISDWNKDHWAFYVYIEQDNYEDDIEQISKLMTKLNYRDGDVYIELINHSNDLEGFYKYVYDSGHYTHSEVLNKDIWEILEEKGDSHFLYFNKLIGSTYISDLQEIEFSAYGDWNEVLETYHPDLYKALDEANGLGSFDIESFYNGWGFDRIDGSIVIDSNH